MPDLKEEPRDIFISAYFTKPLAPNFLSLIKEKSKFLQVAISAIAKLTKGKVHFISSPGEKQDFKDCICHTFQGKHPAGNVGVQIHHIAPIKKGDVVWTIGIEGLLAIGELLETKKIPYKKVISLAGEGVLGPQHYEVFKGQKISEIVHKKLIKEKDLRIISGDVLSGTTKSEKDFLAFYDDQISVIPEVSQSRLFGWLEPGLKRSSFSRTFLSSFVKEKSPFTFNTAMNGGVRNLVQTGDFEKVLPMDIYPQFLIKSILFNDLELMEQLGLLEIIPEDFALCEYICVSKTNIQEIIQLGLNRYQKEAL